MRPLTRSLTRAEVAELLDLGPDVVDALLDAGHVLCHYKGGEPRVPLAQLEEFFRERLVRVYQAEVWREESRTPASEWPSPEPACAEASQEPLAAGSAQPAPPAIPVEEPPASIETGAIDAESDRAEPVAPSASRELPDQRRLPRFIPRRQIDGIFGDVKFTIVQISASGLRIRHRDPVVPGTEAKLTFALLKPARSVVVRCRVVWTSIARSGADTFSISGLRVIEHAERLVRAVESLRATHELQPERRIRQRRSDDALSAVLAEATDEEIALITAAMQRFAADPVEASRWYSRARFAMADEHVRRVAPQKPREREEVLGLWEYLDRQVELEKIVGVVAWTRGAAAAAAAALVAPPN